ncbi:hypothetical protein WICPIJ_002413 [Wickerhamomyces pijperi]|uniref:RNA helicase n=1 Tax=Wickerhamomyces pijperi TaxID=599730 RepID=A0A9P8TPV7_WICPI|nr:hypothetical protein WICPIJ_002413 [Wickerhamomyces pijperi]
MDKVRLKIQEYTGESDPEIADFIISIHNDSTSLESFQSSLHEMAGEDAFTDDFIKGIYSEIKQALLKEKIRKRLVEKSVKKENEGKVKLEDNGTSTMNQDHFREEDQLNETVRTPDFVKKEDNTSTTNPRSIPPVKSENADMTTPQQNSTPTIKPEHTPFKPHYPQQSNIKLAVHEIYKAHISNITSFGAFATLLNTNNTTGLIHISAICKNRVSHPSEILKLNQEVYVEVLDIQDQHNDRRGRKKISLSMKDIDQSTGERFNYGTGSNGTPTGRSNGGDLTYRGRSHTSQNQPRQRLTSPERWEIRQLIASGAIPASAYPELNEVEQNRSGKKRSKDDNDEEMEEEINVEVKHELPPFMTGMGIDAESLGNIEIKEASGKSTSSIPEKEVEGSLTRAAVSGSALAKARRELKMKLLREDKERKLKQRLNKVDDVKINAEEESIRDTEGDQDEEQGNGGSSIKWQQRHNPTKSKDSITFGKRTNLTMKEQRESLPVFAMRDQLIQTVYDNQFTVIVGETGSGKTTQLTQYLNESGLFYRSAKSEKHLMIGCTQPRRVAATSVAKRVAEEMGVQIGEQVGYSIRFEDRTSELTEIKYMTDGMLQREAIRDPLLSEYSVIMLDEAHERTIATDVLFGLLKQACRMRNTDEERLRVIVTSATLNAEKFSSYFDNCPVVTIPGRTFPVEVMFSEEPCMDYLVSCVETVMKIHTEEKTGDILVFLTGQEEIETMCAVLEEKMEMLEKEKKESTDKLIILPVYSALPSEMQSRIFEPTPPNCRKVILATNIAETSLTIDGIFYVIDPGFAKLNAYDAKLGMDTLQVRPISRAQANQRSGRAGRTGPGRCYRLYTEFSYQKEMSANTVPEIQRQNLSNTVLMLKAIGINDILKFEFMDPPSRESILLSLNDLYYLGAIDGNETITEVGKQLVNIPTEPQISKTLLEGVKFNCSEELLTIFAMITTPNIYHRPKAQQEQADKKHARFKSPLGDHLTLLNIYERWVESGFDRYWCEENYIQLRSMNQARDIRNQLRLLFTKFKYPLTSCHGNTDSIRKALCSGFFKNIAKRSPSSSSQGNGSSYETLSELTQVFIHPSSSLSRSSPQYVVYNTILNTTKEYLVHVTTIDPKWLIEIVPEFFEINGKRTIMRKEQEVIKPLFNRFNRDQEGWRLSRPFTGSTKKRFRAG